MQAIERLVREDVCHYDRQWYDGAFHSSCIPTQWRNDRSSFAVDTIFGRGSRETSAYKDLLIASGSEDDFSDEDIEIPPETRYCMTYWADAVPNIILFAFMISDLYNIFKFEATKSFLIYYVRVRII